MKYKINKYLLFFSLLLIGCEERNTIQSGIYKEGQIVQIENETVIISSKPYYEYDNTYYWVKTLNCSNVNYEACTFKVLEEELTIK